MLVKLYGNTDDPRSPERRYSPVAVHRHDSDRRERRRYTRLSNGFSRKIENHMAAVAINNAPTNFIKIHSSLRMTPAMAAGVSRRPWDGADLVALLESSESKKAA